MVSLTKRLMAVSTTVTESRSGSMKSSAWRRGGIEGGWGLVSAPGGGVKHAFMWTAGLFLSGSPVRGVSTPVMFDRGGSATPSRWQARGGGEGPGGEGISSIWRPRKKIRKFLPGGGVGLFVDLGICGFMYSVSEISLVNELTSLLLFLMGKLKV